MVYRKLYVATPVKERSPNARTNERDKLQLSSLAINDSSRTRGRLLHVKKNNKTCRGTIVRVREMS